MSADYNTGRDALNADLDAGDFARAPADQPEGYACTRPGAADRQWWERQRPDPAGDMAEWEPVSPDLRPEAAWIRQPGSPRSWNTQRFGGNGFIASFASAADLTAGKVPWWKDGVESTPVRPRGALGNADDADPLRPAASVGPRQPRFGALGAVALGLANRRARVASAMLGDDLFDDGYLHVQGETEENAGRSAEWRAMAPLIQELRAGQQVEGLDANTLAWETLDKMLAVLDAAASMP